MTVLNIAAFQNTPLAAEPFPYAVIREFINPEAIAGIIRDFPDIEQGGSFPLATLTYGPAFQALCEELRGESLRAAFAEKFQLDLRDRPTTLTVRGRCRAKDGKIHVDSKTKLITVLVYLNRLEEQAGDGGHLRILNSQHDIHDYVAQVPPEPGTMLCFLNGPTAWHGHTSYSGVRRVLQLNWVTDETAVKSSERRHGLSAWFKKWNPFARAA
ncbi:MAG: 2OG-Fe(II) oxygenase [Planctomycetota bacterium]